MSQPPPGSWPPPGGYGPPPQPPPSGGGKRNLIIAIVAVVVVAAGAIIAIVALSGGDDKKAAAQPTVTLTGSPVRPSSPVATSTTASSGGAVTCADIAGSSLLNGKLTLNPGGTKPTDVQLPAGSPSLICSGETHVNETAHVTALVWPGLAQGSYLGQLTRAGWTDNTATPPFHVLGKKGAKYQIVTLELKGSLVAIFGPS
jgi:hypothetical protein